MAGNNEASFSSPFDPSLRSGGSARMTRQRDTGLSRLDAAEPLQLLGLDRYLLPKSHLARGTLKERHPVRVQRLVEGRGTGDSPRELQTDPAWLRLEPALDRCVNTEPFDDGGLHRKLDPIQRYEPNDILKAAIRDTLSNDQNVLRNNVPKPRRCQSIRRRLSEFS